MSVDRLNRREFVKMAVIGSAVGSISESACAVNFLSKRRNILMTMETPDVFEGKYKSLKLGLCQIESKQWDVKGNLRRTLEAIETAAAKGAEIAVTPECVLNGYAFDDRGRLLEISERLDGANLRMVCGKAKEHGMAVVIGFAERGSDDRIHNSAAFISQEGKIVDVYRKVHLRPNEDIEREGPFTAGDKFNVNTIKTADGEFKAGTMICFDREIPETMRCLRSLGSEIILCPLATNTSDMSKYFNGNDNEIITRCRAAENEVFIAVINHAKRYNGGSFVVGPTGKLVHQMGAEPGVDVIELPVGAVAKKFHSDPLGWMGWGYRRQEVYDKYLK